MPVFLVESKLPPFSAEMAALIPAHREVVNDLFLEGKLVMYSVAADRSKWWCGVHASDEFEVLDILSRMPIIKFLKPEIHDLMFYNGADQFIPRISLN
jgi:hypothetical protein